MSELITNKVGAFSTIDYANAMVERVRKAGASNITIVQEPTTYDPYPDRTCFGHKVNVLYYFVYFDAPPNMPF
jgi:hypothetical protein